MLCNLRDICAIAEQNNMALAAVNAASFEAIRAAIDAAEETKLPIIIQHAEGHEPIMPLLKVAPALVALAERSSATICLNLDHCEHLSYAHTALELGFNGVMFDGSMLPYNQNVAFSASARNMCDLYGAGLECELGSMGSREGGESDEGGTAEEAGAIYTNPDLAQEFIEATGCDILACSFGTVHGIYKGEPHLNFDVLTEIRKRVNIPLVMHGGSGVSDADYVRSINAGIRKINYYTYGVKYAGDAAAAVVAQKTAEGPDTKIYWHDLTTVAYESLRNTFEHIMRVYANGANTQF